MINSNNQGVRGGVFEFKRKHLLDFMEAWWDYGGNDLI